MNDQDTSSDAAPDTAPTPDAASFSCESPIDLGHGIEQCAGGWFHRATAIECPAYPTPQCEASCSSECSTPDLECAHVGYTGCQCKKLCNVDADCESGFVCLCGTDFGRCVPATCKTDADCGAESICASYGSTEPCGVVGFKYGIGGMACTSPDDECRSDGDCAPLDVCTIELGKRVCRTPPQCSS